MHVELHEAARDRREVGEVVLLREDVHRGLERALLRGPVDLVDERLGVRRVEDVVVVDPVPVDHVLLAGQTVTDRLETVGERGVVVRPLRQRLQRGDEQLLGLLRLRGGHPGHARQVDLAGVDGAVGEVGQRRRGLHGRGAHRAGAVHAELVVLAGVHAVHALHLRVGHAAVRRGLGLRAGRAAVGAAARGKGERSRRNDRAEREETVDSHDAHLWVSGPPSVGEVGGGAPSGQSRFDFPFAFCSFFQARTRSNASRESMSATDRGVGSPKGPA